MKPISVAEIKLNESEIEAAVSVLRSGALRQGKQCEAFEDKFREKVGAKHAITCANGSAALHLAYMCLLQADDEVLVPSFTFFATASMVTMSGARPIICDVDRDTFLIDLNDAAQRITPRTKVIAPVHLFGNVCNVDEIMEFAGKHNLKIVWDAAQAHGARFKDKDIGSFGDFTCYSFYPSKNMFVGEGGMICADGPEFAEKVRFMRTHGQTGKYYHTMLGFNYRMTDVEAAIGLIQLQRLDSMLEIRQRNAAILNEGLKDVAGLKLQRITPGSMHAWHQYCAVIDAETFGCDRDTLAKKLKEKGIATGVHYPRGLHQQPIFQQLYGNDSLPNTELLAESILALPVHHGLTREDTERIVDEIRTVQRAN